MSYESVKVCDLELEKLANVAKCWDEIESVMERYVNIMRSVQDETIKEGEIHETIDLLRFYAEDTIRFAAGLGSNAASKANALVSKAEAIDLKLYNEV